MNVLYVWLKLFLLHTLVTVIHLDHCKKLFLQEAFHHSNVEFKSANLISPGKNQLNTIISLTFKQVKLRHKVEETL